MKSTFKPGDEVKTNRIYKKRFGKVYEGTVIKNVHFGRFVIVDISQEEVSISPEYLELVK